MKRILLVLTVILTASLKVFSQSDTTEFHNQIGINATGFVKTFLNFSGNSTPSNNPYLLSYKYIKNGRGGRAGIGYNYATTKLNPNDGSPLIDTRAQTFDLRMGYEWQKSLSKHWNFYYGVDFIYSSSDSLVETLSFNGKSTVEQQVKAYGGGPVLGFEFKIGKRLRLNTETAIYASYMETKNKITNSAFPQFDDNTFQSGNRIRFILPTTFYFVVLF